MAGAPPGAFSAAACNDRKQLLATQPFNFMCDEALLSQLDATTICQRKLWDGVHYDCSRPKQ
eukprot:2429813-Amphidinium_carterae.2